MPVRDLLKASKCPPKDKISNSDPVGKDFKKNTKASFVVLIFEPDIEPLLSTMNIYMLLPSENVYTS